MENIEFDCWWVLLWKTRTLFSQVQNLFRETKRNDKTLDHKTDNGLIQISLLTTMEKNMIIIGSQNLTLEKEM